MASTCRIWARSDPISPFSDPAVALPYPVTVRVVGIVGTGAGSVQPGARRNISSQIQVEGGPMTSTLRPAVRLAVLSGLLPLMLWLGGCSKNLTVQVAGVGKGGVTSSPAGISCGTSGPTCATSAKQGTAFDLNASPGPGSVFAGWSGACSGGTPTCQVTLNNDATVIAWFRTTQVST